jgi:aspartyl/asparaginyl-tRNA synthetase
MTVLTGEDARAFRYEMKFTDITSEMVSHMARKVDPESWEEPFDIIARLQAMKVARQYLKAMLSYTDAIKIVKKAVKLNENTFNDKLTSRGE